MLYENTGRNWLLKYKLHHIPFWCLYNYLWWVVALGNPLKAVNSIFFTPQIVQFIFYVVFQAAAVYFNLYFLIPRYLEKSKFPAYIGLLLTTILSSTLLIVSGYYLSAYISGKSLEQIYGKGVDCFAHFFGYAFPSTMAAMTFAMSIKLTQNWIQTKRKQQLLEKEKLETELKFLKNQFNPHFLFNTINSIFFLIHKNPYKASASLAKFSELLRYQLYECNDKLIPLSNEIAYLENFIELEKLRQNDNMEVSVLMDQQYTKHLGIAPFILMTFVENAFKHVSRHTDKANWIRIKLHVEQEQLIFSISNSTAVYKPNDVIHYGGIGLKNVQRRLELIYSGKYQLDVQSNRNSFEVQLRLHLTELVVLDVMKKTA
jgi:two-component system LytT family sensor kinase